MVMRHIPERSLARFWSKVEKTDGCWLWRGALNGQGYGNVNILGRWWRAHRYAFMLAGNALPDDADLCHRCDTPACVRPDHLFVGTRTDNMQDAKAKGRTARGESHGRRKLDAATVQAIRDTFAAHPSRFRDLGSAFGISAQHAHRIVRGERWQHEERHL